MPFTHPLDKSVNGARRKHRHPKPQRTSINTSNVIGIPRQWKLSRNLKCKQSGIVKTSSRLVEATISPPFRTNPLLTEYQKYDCSRKSPIRERKQFHKIPVDRYECYNFASKLIVSKDYCGNGNFEGLFTTSDRTLGGFTYNKRLNFERYVQTDGLRLKWQRKNAFDV